MSLGTSWTDASRAHRVVVRERAAGMDIDYADAFAADRRAGDTRSAEARARAALEAAPIGPVIYGLWRTLGFRLGPRTGAGHVLGLRVARSEPDRVELVSEGGRTTARIVLAAASDELVTTTFLAFSSRVTKAAWLTVLAPGHRRIVRLVMDRAAVT